MVLAASIPSYFCALIFLWNIDYSTYAKILLTTLLSLSVFGFAWLIKKQLQFQFQTLSNLVEAVRGGDPGSQRGRFWSRVAGAGGSPAWHFSVRSLSLDCDRP